MFKSKRLLFHVSHTPRLTELEPRRAKTVQTFSTEHASKVEGFMEAVRTNEFPQRPSRLNSVFFSPNVRSGVMTEAISLSAVYDGKEATFYAAEVERSSSRFFTSMRPLDFVASALVKNDHKKALDYARLYWKGPSSFRDVKFTVKSGYGEVLVPGKVKVSSFSLRPNLAKPHEPLIEGLAHGGLAQKIRRVLTHFGSGWQGLSPVGSGTSVLSNEELARNEVFYHVKRSGALTYMGKQPDIRTSEGAVLGFHKLTGDLRVVNNYMPVSDSQAIERFRPAIKQALSPEDAQLLTKAIMKTGLSEAASSTMATASKIIRGARRMPKI